MKKKTHPDAQIINAIGQTVIARYFGIKQPSVAGWCKNGIPFYRREKMVWRWPEHFNDNQKAA